MRWFKKLFIFLFLFALLWFVVARLDVDRLLREMYHLRLVPVVIMVILFVVSFLLWNLRWWFSLRFLGKVSFWRLLPVLMAGMFVNNVTPFAGTGGEPLRAFHAQRLMRKPGLKVFVLTVLEKLFGAVVVFLFLIVSLLFVVVKFDAYPVLQGIAFLFLAVLIVMAILGVLLFGRLHWRKLLLVDLLLSGVYWFRPLFSYLQKFSSANSFRVYINRKIDHGKVFVGRWLGHKDFVAINILITLVITLVNFLTLYACFFALSFPIPFFSVVVVYTLATVLSDFSFSPGGVGIVEVLNVGLFSALGVPLEIAALVTLLNRVVYYVFALGIGYLCVLALHWKD
ncbi:MAG TPA: flippase-like domain-containing protein [Candidatus Nanoarchaeia archaeon]|nr:flippase-like domain-containing protein [Candidatus Nanoarchaeia archaeon]